MLYVAVISVVFLAAGLAMLSKLGQGNSAALELAVARAHAGRKVQLAFRSHVISIFSSTKRLFLAVAKLLKNSSMLS